MPTFTAPDTSARYNFGSSANTSDDPAKYEAGFPAATGLVLESRQATFSATTGGTTTKIYTSVTKADIGNLCRWYAAQGASFSVMEGQGKYSATITLPYDEFTDCDDRPLDFAIWEIQPTTIQRSMYDIGIFSPAAKDGARSTKRERLSLIQKAAVQIAAKNPSQTVNLDINGSSLYSSKQFLAQNYLALERLKTTNVMAFTHTIRRTYIQYSNFNGVVEDPAIYANQSSYGNTVFSKQDMMALYNIPKFISDNMIDGYRREKTIKEQDSVLLLGLSGYLQCAPTVTQISPFKKQVSYTWTWDEWLDSLYSPYNNNITKFPLRTT